jgi:hypothetical protein
MPHFIAEQRKRLTPEAASDLLKQRGYVLIPRFGHVHATDGKREWHICRLDELPSMETAQFLTRLSDALAWLSKLDEASSFSEKNALLLPQMSAPVQEQMMP